MNQFFPTTEHDSDSTIRDLFATNGYMLDMIIESTVEVVSFRNESDHLKSLIYAMKQGSTDLSTQIHAIIDCGAILAGSDLKDFSRVVLHLLPRDRFEGVLFYDGVTHHDWVILERSGRCLPKDISPVDEKDSFAIFDEPRCRGTDLKLRTDAVALLTLAPNM